MQRLGGTNDQFSIRYTGVWAYYPGTTTFSMRSDDGSRVFVDGALVMDNWANPPYEYNLPNSRSAPMATLSFLLK